MVKIKNNNLIIEIETNGAPIDELTALQKGVICALQNLRPNSDEEAYPPVYYLSIILKALLLDENQVENGIAV